MNHVESAPGKANIPTGVTAMGGSSARDYRPMGQLEREDIVILFLSVILSIATVWLATTVL
ncbi:MAG: hypothetical protein ABSG32_15235 [Terriglobia bacterium]|jgi:hypothetical protein